MDVIKLVSGDDLPQITLTLTDDTSGEPIDLSDPSTSVNVKFRQAGTTTVLSTISCAITDGVNGIVTFDFTGALDSVTAGLYEGEIEISFSGSIQTIWEPLKFRVRDEF